MVNHLTRMGIVLLARDHAERGIPLAGRLKHFFHTRPVGARNSPRLQDTVYSETATGMPPKTDNPVTGREQPNGR